MHSPAFKPYAELELPSMSASEGSLYVPTLPSATPPVLLPYMTHAHGDSRKRTPYTSLCSLQLARRSSMPSPAHTTAALAPR